MIEKKNNQKLFSRKCLGIQSVEGRHYVASFKNNLFKENEIH